MAVALLWPLFILVSTLLVAYFAKWNFIIAFLFLNVVAIRAKLDDFFGLLFVRCCRLLTPLHIQFLFLIDLLVSMLRDLLVFLFLFGGLSIFIL